MRTSSGIFFFQLLALCKSSWSQSLDNEERNWISGISFCGCQDCDKAAYGKDANGFSCGDRILNLIFSSGMTEQDACHKVSADEFPRQCGPACDPSRCDGRDPPPTAVSAIVKPAPAHCGCASCSDEIWNRPVGFPAYTCGARIEWLQKVRKLDVDAACYEVAALQFSSLPRECGLCNPQRCGIQAAPEMRPAIETVPEPEPPVVALPAAANNVANVAQTRCGCTRCTENILNSQADGHRCGDRIDYLLKTSPWRFPTEEDACRQIAHVEFPSQCGPQCDPDRCHGNPSQWNSPGPAPTNRGGSHDMDLYCFPPIDSRETYNNVWGKYTLQAKDSAVASCGPSDNLFSADAVSLANNGRDLKLEFKKVGNKWHASEVRILLPEPQMPYNYGSYTFSVKSIRVLDSRTGALVSTVLPPSLILGLFTWDPTENYAIHENMNHEVDVEISRWNDPDNADAQFLVQPPGDPQTHRFFTGSSGNTYQQAPRIYGFDWRPTEVEWFSNAGQGGQRFVYSTQDALDAGQIDYNQCMPANAEVRINLWNLYGSKSNPTEMADTHVAEVVIDNFQFVPSGETFVEDGHVCSKDCHCGPSSQCRQNRCVRNGRTRRLQTPPELHDHADPVVTAPIVMILMLCNLFLAAIVVHRNIASSSSDVEMHPSATPTNAMTSKEKSLEIQAAVVH